MTRFIAGRLLQALLGLIFITTLVFFLVPDFTMIAFATALDPLRSANRMLGYEAYRWRLASIDGKPVPQVLIKVLSEKPKNFGAEQRFKAAPEPLVFPGDHVFQPPPSRLDEAEAPSGDGEQM